VAVDGEGTILEIAEGGRLPGDRLGTDPGLVIVSATVPDRALLLPGAAAGPAAEPLLLLELILSWRGSDAHDMVTRKFWVKDGEISLRDDEVCCRKLF